MVKNGLFGDGDDIEIAVLPRVSSDSESVTLELASNLVLPPGSYRLSVFSSASQSIHDSAGLPLDGDSNGIDGGDFIRDFDVVANSQPVALTQSVSVVEDTPQMIVLMGDDNDQAVTQALKFWLDRLPTAGTLSLTPSGPAITAASLPMEIPSGELFYRPVLDSTQSEQFRFYVQDDGGVENGGEDTSEPAFVNINVLPVPDAPVLNDVTTIVAENAANGEAIIQLTAEDPDLADAIPDQLAYEILSGDPLSAFGITEDGLLFVANRSQIDAETQAAYSLIVRVTDSSGLSDTGTIQIQVQDIVEATVEEVTINAGDPQRSTLEKIKVTFNQIVDIDFEGTPFQVRNTDTDEVVDVQAIPSEIDGKNGREHHIPVRSIG